METQEVLDPVSIDQRSDRADNPQSGEDEGDERGGQPSNPKALRDWGLTGFDFVGRPGVALHDTPQGSEELPPWAERTEDVVRKEVKKILPSLPKVEVTTERLKRP